MSLSPHLNLVSSVIGDDRHSRLPQTCQTTRINWSNSLIKDPVTDFADACGVTFVTRLDGTADRKVVQAAIDALAAMCHRGAVGFCEKTGDGAGILISIPDLLFRTEPLGFKLPPQGEYAVGTLFIPKTPGAEAHYKDLVQRVFNDQQLEVLGFRDVPVRPEVLGDNGRKSEPKTIQVFVKKPESITEPQFEDALFWTRKIIERESMRTEGQYAKDGSRFVVTTLSPQTIVYKGLMLPDLVAEYYPDLANQFCIATVAEGHSRFATNSDPVWEYAQPFSSLSHNGEKNSVSANRYAMHARARSELGTLWKKMKSLGVEAVSMKGSDSATLNNGLEIYQRGGFSQPEALIIMMPPAFENDKSLGKHIEAMHRYYMGLQEPWDGPAAVAFTDGKLIGARLDRNGLRPAKYVITDDGLIVYGSEVGIHPAGSRVDKADQLSGGGMFVVRDGKIYDHHQIAEELARKHPYEDALKRRISIPVGTATKNVASPNREDRLGDAFEQFTPFCWFREDFERVARTVDESIPLVSMGDDARLALLSPFPYRLFSYIRHPFAQVTNPPLDSKNESANMDLNTVLGSSGDPLSFSIDAGAGVEVPMVLNPDQVAGVQAITEIKVETVPALLSVEKGEKLIGALDRICLNAQRAVEDGARILVISDKDWTKGDLPIPSAVVIGAINAHLIERGLRPQVSLVAESGDVNNAHDMACLLCFGADAVAPHMAYKALDMHIADGRFKEVQDPVAALDKSYKLGVLKIIAKFGISTGRSYVGGRDIIEALGISPEVIDRCAPGMPSRLGGLTFEDIEQLMKSQMQEAVQGNPATGLQLRGDFVAQYGGERHRWNHQTVMLLQKAVGLHTGEPNREAWREFVRHADSPPSEPFFIRDLFKIRDRGIGPELTLDYVESAASILERFVSGAMSYGALSEEAHRTLAIAMNRVNGRSNSGEGGEDPSRDGTEAVSRIRQAASARFGVTNRYLNGEGVTELQIKMAQGAKPGEGGELKGKKVYPWIANVRHTVPYQTLVSPPPHHDIYSIEDLSQLVFDLKNSNPYARVSIKLVAGSGVGTIASGCAKMPGVSGILVSGAEGGTGASPEVSVKFAGLPSELGLSETQQSLVANRLRDRIVLQNDGQLVTALDMIKAAILGADEFGLSTAALIAEGCIMMRVCHEDTCPVGVAVQNPKLRSRFAGKPEHIIQYLNYVAEDMRSILAAIGATSLNEIIGRVDLLEVAEEAAEVIRRKNIDVSRILFKDHISTPDPSDTSLSFVSEVPFDVTKCHDYKFTHRDDVSQAINTGSGKLEIQLSVKNTDRAIGTYLSGHIARSRRGKEDLEDNTIVLTTKGYAGQSLGAFLEKGVTIKHRGRANDYVGKGLSGGIISVSVGGGTRTDEPVVGNVVLYGATSGKSFFCGKAGERFCVRASGNVETVVEGTGPFPFEYMTGGRALVLGKMGKNAFAGASGGEVYISADKMTEKEIRSSLDPKADVVLLKPEELTEEDVRHIERSLGEHQQYTGSVTAGSFLEENNLKGKFYKLVPREFYMTSQRPPVTELQILGQ